MSYYSRFYPFIRPYLPKMILACSLVVGVAVLNLAQAQANRYSDTAALFQALGGGWWNRQSRTP